MKKTTTDHVCKSTGAHKTCKCETENHTCHCHEGKGKECDYAKVFIKSSVVIVAAVIIAISILATKTPQKPQKMPAIAAPVNVEAQIRKFIETNPKFIIDTVDKYYKNQKPAPQDEAAAKKAQQDQEATIAKHLPTILNDKTNHSLGNEKGEYVIVEFFDYNCGWCKKTNHAMWDVVNSDKGKNIRWILIDSPIFGENSEMMSRYVLAAGNQGKFADMHHGIANAKAKLDEAGVIELAKTFKMDIEKLKTDAASDAIKEKIKSNQAIARELGVRGVPFLIVNGKPNPGALIGEKLDAAVAESNK